MGILIGKPIGCPRRGSMYVVVLGSAMIVSVIGLSSLIIMRINLRSLDSATEATETRFYARSGIEAAVVYTLTDGNWRSTLSSGDILGSVSIGRGACSATLVDETDGDLADDPDQPVRLTGIGQIPPSGDPTAEYRYSVLAQPPALSSLHPAIHAAGQFVISGGATLTLSGGPASSGNVFANMSGTVNGDVEAVFLSNFGTITGTITEGIPPKQLPAAATVAYYRNLATSIPWSAISGGTIELVVLSHNSNPYGAVNPDGLYYINAPADLTIEDCRIEGTLVIDMNQDQELRIRRGIHWEPHRADYPALIVAGDCEIRIEYPLSEPDAGVNFNPTGTPYQGSEDTDTADVYPGVIKGLIHVAGSSTSVTLKSSTQIEGALIAEGKITVQDNVTVTADPNLVFNPPKRYRASHLEALSGTWQRVTTP